MERKEEPSLEEEKGRLQIPTTPKTKIHGSVQSFEF
jgi:hypothetical protein